MHEVRAIYRHGIEIELAADTWRFAASNESSGTFESRVELETKCALGSPVLIEFQNNETRSRNLINPKSGRLFGVELSELQMSRTVFKSYPQTRPLVYGLGCVVHHVQRMALTYAEVCRSIHRIPVAEQFGRITAINYQGQEEIYFELDATVTAARRLFNVPANLLWNHYGGRKGQAPSSIEEVIRVCTAIPASLKDFIARSIREPGKRVTDYRDCVQHYAPLEYGLGTAQMALKPPGVWAATVLIPDNPESRSRLKFTYLSRCDALNYSLDLAAVLSSYVSTIMNAVAPVLIENKDSPDIQQ